ncbi:MAG TPA: hypothetical protein VM487_09425 [Phycisphaerae bacterium]|nr:hypothetical protein [Phycisphaerae bacterium]
MQGSRLTIFAIALALGSVIEIARGDVLGTAFTYQAQLKDAGLPAAGDYDFVFRLFDAVTDGVQIGSDFPVDDWPVSNGLFTVQVDFGDSAFNSEAHWLQVAVRPWDSNDPHTVLSPRQPVTAAPVALYALDGPGSGGFWTLNGDDIYNNNAGGVGIGTTTSPYSMLDVQSTEDTHGIMSTVPWIPVWAHRDSTTGTWPAIHGECDSEAASGSAIRGIMTSTSPGSSSAAVRGINNGTGGAGIGVVGTQDGSGYGVYGYTPDGRGVYGSSTSGTGVWGSGGLQGGYFEDSDQSGHAHVGDGDNGISAYGTHAGGLFVDSDDSAFTYVGYGDYGISAWATSMGGYFRDSDDSGYARVGYGDYGIQAYGTERGGHFEDTNSSGYASVGYGSYKIFGNGTVSFVQNHPDDADNVIVYACPEGDEVATYTRGTARLVNGEAVVQLGETFKWVTNPDIGLTAHLTPRGKGSVLYVESLSTREMLVRSMDGFPDDIAFDYIVYGLRIGFEEVSIVQEKDREAYIPSMADHRELYERRPELRKYNGLERFGAMRAALGETGPLDLTASRALRDAIVEFDPAVHELPGGGRLPPDDPVPAGERDDSGSAVSAIKHRTAKGESK